MSARPAVTITTDLADVDASCRVDGAIPAFNGAASKLEGDAANLSYSKATETLAVGPVQIKASDGAMTGVKILGGYF